MDPLIQFHTFGCKVNTYDTGLLQNRLRGLSVSNHAKPQEAVKPKIHVLNTCAVTAEATQQAKRLVRKIKREDPQSVVVVTGCAAQVDSEVFQNLKEVDLLIANSHKMQIRDLLKDYLKGEVTETVHRSNIFKKDDLEGGGGLESEHRRSFLKIQDGCNSFCSFCIIPYARGKSRSLPIADLVERIRGLEAAGIPEIVLTGVHIGDYDDEGKTLDDLVEAVLRETRIPRIRLTSLEPIEISDRMLDLYQDSRLCPHFHLSIQSASTNVLRQMKRKYDGDAVRGIFEKIHARVPGAFVGMDVIAGFPTETEDEFLETYQLLETTPWTRMHVFPYSERSGTRAATLPQIPMEVRKARARRLRELSQSRFAQHQTRQIGTTKSVLPLRDPRRGLSRDYWNIRLLEPATAPDEISVRIVGIENTKEGTEPFLMGVYGAP